MNPWKLATIGIALVTLTAGATGLTTVYFLRSAAADEQTVATSPRPPVRQAVAARPRAMQATPVAYRPVATANDPTDCATGGDRAWRVAKPGLLGTLLGAGLGAAGGAIADGGKGAGKGALIGGITGAVAGSAYGAYKTNKECGTIFGSDGGAVAPRAVDDGTVVGASAPFAPRDSGDSIAVYAVR